MRLLMPLCLIFAVLVMYDAHQRWEHAIQRLDHLSKESDELDQLLKDIDQRLVNLSVTPSTK